MTPTEPAAAAAAQVASEVAASAVTPAAASAGSYFLPGLLLAALAVAAALLSRRRALAPRMVQVLETVSLGPRRSLVLARLQGESLLLGVSESGVSLLLARPAPPDFPPALAHAGQVQVQAVDELLAEPVEPVAAPPAVAAGAPAASITARLRAAAEQTFAQTLATSAEDLELRRKLSGRGSR